MVQTFVPTANGSELRVRFPPNFDEKRHSGHGAIADVRTNWQILPMKRLISKIGWKRWLLWGWIAVAFFAESGFSAHSIMWAIAVAAFSGAFWAVETKSQSSRRAYYRIAVVSSALLFVLVNASWQGRWGLALATWAVSTLLMIILTTFYEQTKPSD